MSWTNLKQRLFEARMGLQYTLFARRNPFADDSRFMNMGYWESDPESLDEACRAMARLVAETAGFAAGERILDVGFGFADQDFFWLEHFDPREIIGLDLARHQVREARRRVAERGLEDRIRLRRGSATAMRFADRSFDVVVSLESAFHFALREDFFTQAWRVLRPGGRLVLTDMIPLGDGEHSLQQVAPRGNLYGREVYTAKLEAAGFEEVEVRSIRERVCVPYCRYVARRLADPEMMGGLGPIARRAASASAEPELYSGLDYVIASARRSG